MNCHSLMVQECKVFTAMLENLWQLLRKLNIFLSPECQSYSSVFTHISWKLIFTQKPAHGCLWAAWSMIAKTWKQSIFFSRWVGQSTVMYPYKEVMITRNELSSYKKPWRNLKYTFPSERIQSEMATHYMISVIWHLEKANWWQLKDQWLLRDLRQGRQK